MQKILKEKNLDSMLFLDKSNVRYLTKFSGSFGIVLILKNSKYFLTDSRYILQAEKEVGKEFIIIECNKNFAKTIYDILIKSKIENLGIESTVDLDFYFNLKNIMLNIEIKVMKNFLKDLRVIKNSIEIELIGKAASIIDEAFLETLNIIKKGITEKEIAAYLEYKMKLLGSGDTSFQTIVASGYRSALAHGIASSKKIKGEEFILFDIGVFYNGYTADMSRTVYFGDNPSEKHINMYNAVLDTQNKVINNIKIGTKISELDKISHENLNKFGYKNHYTHGLGHGIGLDIHEPPFINTQNNDIIMENMVFTVEPAIYEEGFGGVRIEDDIFVTKTGAEILNKSEKKLLILS